jgi:hypothetical protein
VQARLARVHRVPVGRLDERRQLHGCVDDAQGELPLAAAGERFGDEGEQIRARSPGRAS